MTLVGRRLGTYRVTSKLGEGGMGEVYRATDSKLEREVAIKVLPEGFTEDQERLTRFEREARVLAQLHHPNIASIFGLEDADGVRGLVMELVDGPTLAERLEQGPLPLDECLAVAVQIAEALAAAHDKGIVHRDLKPQNIKLAHDGESLGGTVKVLDFGLAKAMDPAGSAGDATGQATSGAGSPSQLTASPTLTLGATQLGVILGTAPYMSPEQAKGAAVDKRADVWAFGVVLFEMLSGRRLFEGGSVPETLAGVLKSEIDLDAVPASTPPAIRRLLRRCLTRDPRNRLHDMADARLELTEAEALPGDSAVEVDRRSNRLAPLAWIVAAVAIGVAAWGWLGRQDAAETPMPVAAQLLPAPGTTPLVAGGFAISPDGSQLAYAALEAEMTARIWVRSLRDGRTRPIEGTENGKRPFWSPDGRVLGFFQGEQTKTVDLDRGVVQVLPGIDVDRPWASWNDDGVILAASRTRLVAVPAAGGEASAVPTRTFDATDGEASAEILAPSFLPDGVHFLYLLRDYGTDEPKGELRVGSLDGSRDELLMRSDSNALYAPSGELVWWQDGNLRAQPFDPERLELTGAQRVVHGDVQFDPREGIAAFSIALDGTIVVREGGIVAGDQLVLVDRGGSDLAVVGPPGNYYSPKLSPDGALVAVDQSDEANRGDIWIYEIARGTGTRLTSAPEDETEPTWSPDGRQLAFQRTVGEGGAILVRALRGVDDERRLTRAEDDRLSLAPRSWPASGTIAAQPQGKSSFRGIAFLGVTDGTLELTPPSPFPDSFPAFSPDGRFLALESGATGRSEVYVRPFPDETDRWRVSIDGGRTPFWRSDGAELYFVGPRSEVVAVSVRPGPDGTTLTFGEPKSLFRAELKSNTILRQIDTIDGRAFLVNRSVIDVESAPFTVIAYGLAPGG